MLTIALGSGLNLMISTQAKPPSRRFPYLVTIIPTLRFYVITHTNLRKLRVGKLRCWNETKDNSEDSTQYILGNLELHLSKGI